MSQPSFSPIPPLNNKLPNYRRKCPLLAPIPPNNQSIHLIHPLIPQLIPLLPPTILSVLQGLEWLLVDTDQWVVMAALMVDTVALLEDMEVRMAAHMEVTAEVLTEWADMEVPMAWEEVMEVPMAWEATAEWAWWQAVTQTNPTWSWTRLWPSKVWAFSSAVSVKSVVPWTRTLKAFTCFSTLSKVSLSIFRSL